MNTTFAHGRMDGRTFFEKVFFFLSDQEYIYMSVYMTKVSTPLFHIGNRYENGKIAGRWTYDQHMVEQKTW